MTSDRAASGCNGFMNAALGLRFAAFFFAAITVSQWVEVAFPTVTTLGTSETQRNGQVVNRPRGGEGGGRGALGHSPAQVPVCPHPPSARAVSGNRCASTMVARATGAISIW